MFWKKIKNLKFGKRFLAFVLAFTVITSTLGIYRLKKIKEVNRVKGYLEDFLTEDNYIDFILIEKRVGKESSDRFITIDSTLGKSIVGKRVNDKFSYKTCSGHVIEGIIMKCGVKEDKDLQIVKR